MKLSSLQTLLAVVATATLASAARSDSSSLPLQARESEQSDSVSVGSAGEGPAEGEYVILSDDGVEQASVVVHKGAVAASEEDSLRKLYAWLGAYFARRDHASEAPVLPAKSGILHPQHAVIYKQQVVPAYNQQNIPAYHSQHSIPTPLNRNAVPATHGQAYGYPQRPFNSQQSYRPKPQHASAYPYSSPGFNTNPGYNGSPTYNGNSGFSSPGYNTNPGYNGYTGYSAGPYSASSPYSAGTPYSAGSPYSAYAAYNAYPYAAYAYNAYLQNLRSAMASVLASSAYPAAPSYDPSPSINAAPLPPVVQSVMPAQNSAPSFNGFTSTLPHNEKAQDTPVHSLPGFASFPPDSLSALVSPLTAAQRRAQLAQLEAQHALHVPKPQDDEESEGVNLQAQFDAQQEKMQEELELQQKALEVQKVHYAQQEKMKLEVEAQQKALMAQREYQEQQAKLKALHEEQMKQEAEKVTKGEAGDIAMYDEVEPDEIVEAPAQGKSFLYGAYSDAIGA